MKRVVPVTVAVFAAAVLLTAGCGGGSGSTPSSSFSTDAPSLVKSALPTNQTTQSVALAFQTVSNADQYVVEFSSTPGFADTTVESAFYSPYAASTVALTPRYNLGDKYQSATTLYYRVGARSSLGPVSSDYHYSTPDSFTKTGDNLSPTPAAQ